MDDEKNIPAPSREELIQQLADCRAAYQRRTEQFKRLLEQAKGLTGNLRRNFEGIIHILNDVTARTSPAMGGHAKRVAALARRIAHKLHLNPDRRQLVFYAASLHDLSLIGREEEWLSGEGEEWTSHPRRSAELIATIHNLNRIAAVIHAHHECVNGTGFPDGLTGDEIPLESRIIGAVTVYDRRTVLAAGPSSKALEEMRESQKFDSRVLSILEKIVHSGEERQRRGDRFLNLEELAPGMLLADDLILESGLVLYPRTTILDEEILTRIRAFAGMLPADHLIRVYPGG